MDEFIVDLLLLMASGFFSSFGLVFEKHPFSCILSAETAELIEELGASVFCRSCCNVLEVPMLLQCCQVGASRALEQGRVEQTDGVSSRL
jgi:hypothetical protein